MRILEIQVSRYGPLVDIDRLPLKDFDLFFGKNESGKTLLVDAILRMLLRGKRDLQNFENIYRIEENPEGYLLFEFANKSHKLPEEDDATSIVGLNAEEFRNTFVVRDGDLTLVNESNFYTSVTDRLTGLHTKKIELVCDELAIIAKLTNPSSTSGLSDRLGLGKIKSRLRDAKNILTTIVDLRKRMIDQNFEELEQKLVEKEIQSANLNNQILLLEEAYKRERYEMGVERLGNLETAIIQLEELLIFSSDDRDKWRDAENENENLAEQLSDKKNKLESLESDLVEQREALKEAQKEKEILERKENDIKKIQIETFNFTQQVEEYAGKNKLAQQLSFGAIAGFIGFCISLIAYIFSQEIFLVVLSIILALTSIAIFVWWLSITVAIARLEKQKKVIIHESARIGIEGDSIDLILVEIQKYFELLEDAKNNFRDLSNDISSLEKQIQNQMEDIEKFREKQNKNEEIISSFLNKSNASDIDLYTTKLNERAEREKAREREIEALKSAFGDEGISIEDRLIHWREEIDNLAEFKDKAVDVKYNEKEVNKCKEESFDLDVSISVIKAQLIEFRDDLRSIAQSATKILRSDEVILCETSRELNEIENRLLRFIEDVEIKEKNAKIAIEIFEKISAEEEENVAKLFGKDSPASLKFKEITGGIYQSIEYDQEKKKIWTCTAEHDCLNPDQLSKGTYDQLYLSVRLAMAETLLPNEAGFLILDDPFLASDGERLLNQIELLRSLVKEGWQIIYFSVKDEIFEALKGDIDKKVVNLHRLSSIHELPA